MDDKEYLIAKSDGVRDCVKWLEQELKKQEIRVTEANVDYENFGRYEDCGGSYRKMKIEEESKMETMVNIKVSLEKYMKKLKHESEEI